MGRVVEWRQRRLCQRCDQPADYRQYQQYPSTLNKTAYVERYFYWNSESKAHVYEGGRLTDLGRVYAASDGGLGYKKSYEFVPKVVLNNPIRCRERFRAMTSVSSGKTPTAT